MDLVFKWCSLTNWPLTRVMRAMTDKSLFVIKGIEEKERGGLKRMFDKVRERVLKCVK